jgi:hypothetical protein
MSGGLYEEWGIMSKLKEQRPDPDGRDAIARRRP